MDRTGKERVVVPVLEPKNTEWQDDIFAFCLESMETGDIPSCPSGDELTLRQGLEEVMEFPLRWSKIKPPSPSRGKNI